MNPPDSKEQRRRGRWRGITGAPARIWTEEFQMQVALLGIERWDRLGAEEQQRFRQLIRHGSPNPKKRLSEREYRELRTMWKRLEPSDLVRSAIRLATHAEPVVAARARP
jgi:hypothetical protein